MPAITWRFAALVVLLSASVSAQTSSGTILGTIRDSQDAAIPGAKVTVTNTGSGIAKTFVTDTTGSYVIPYLLPGQYSVSVEAQGFRPRGDLKAMRDSALACRRGEHAGFDWDGFGAED